MLHPEGDPQPQLAPPVALLRSNAAIATLPAVLVVALVSFGAYSYAPSKPTLPPPPSSADQLSGNVVTIISSDDRAGQASAVAALQLPDPQRKEIERLLQSGEQRIGWIVLTDSIDPDGDVVAVEAAGWTQNIVLSKAWTPVAVPVSGDSPITVTGVKDGMRGGITVALATRSGPVNLRVLTPGERVEIAP